MKKLHILAIAAFSTAVLTGCNDFLDDNRYPLTSIVNSPEYWSNAANCQLQVDRFTDELSQAYGTSANGWFLFKTLSDDQVGSSFANWAYPAETSDVSEWNFRVIRGCNYVIEGVAASSLSASEKANFTGIARMVRGYKYYTLVRMFGDVTWEDKVVDINDTEILYGPRTPRDEVMDNVVADLQYAIENIAADDSKTTWSKDYARAILSEVALYEGTFCRYRTQTDNGLAPNEERAKKYLEISASASEYLLGKYGFCDDYQSIYNSVWTADAANGLTGLSSNPELIVGRRYDAVNGRNSIIAYTCSSTTTSGMSLDGFNAFLFKDGKPRATTSLDNTLVGVPEVDGESKALSIQNLLDVREERLSIMTDPYVYYQGMTWSRHGASGMTSSSGFGVAKFDNINLPLNVRTNDSQGYTSAPIYWTSYIACNYAEAKAELGQFDQTAFNKSLKKLYERAGLGAIITGPDYLASLNDPDNNMGVSSLLWEVRRCRRCELMFDNWIRYWDLVRWHQLDLLDSTKHPNVLRGAYVANSPVLPGGTSVDGEGFYRSYTNERTFSPKYYLYPIPTAQITLNPELGKNPNW
ncbi:MAG: RagB/SusD family nutrient uptake outer membrane protein [Muribaculaceae bacterium]|nr:RagB/SusD family nutrient uptake outer membrane protein [Muribaculaceae bacterium]